MSQINFTKQQLKEYLINRSFLIEKSKSLLHVLESLSCIQVDPINVVTRSHELALWNRVEDLKREDFDLALYKDRNLFEYWLQLYAFIPTKSRPYFGIRMHSEGNWPAEYYRDHVSQLDAVIQFIEEHGPTSAAELTHIPHGRNLFSWNSDKSRTALLNYLWDRGTISVSHRVHNRKYYDLSERLFDKEHLLPATKEESLEFIIKSQFDYLGIVRPAFLSRMGYVKNLGLKELFAEMVKKDIIARVFIEGKKSPFFFMESRDKKAKEEGQMINDNRQIKNVEPKTYNLEPFLRILPPLDPLTIDRRILKDVFDFDYTWEAYVPAKKRKFGYYGMPILYNGEFVGQIELRKDKNDTLSIINLQKVKNVGKDFDALLRQEIIKLQTFVFA